MEPKPWSFDPRGFHPDSLRDLAFNPRSTDTPLPEPEATVYPGWQDPDAEDTEEKRATSQYNMIEERYRTNLNDKIAELRDSVPSLRAISKGTDEENNERDNDGLQGLTPTHKLSKATVLSKATEYIRHLEKLNTRLAAEKREADIRIRQFEKLLMHAPSAPSVISRDSGYASLHRTMESIADKGPSLFAGSTRDGVDAHSAPSQGGRRLESSIHPTPGLGHTDNPELHGNALVPGVADYDGFQDFERETDSQAESDWHISNRSLDVEESRNPLGLIREAAAKALFEAFVITRSQPDSNPNDADGDTNDQDRPRGESNHSLQQSNTGSAHKPNSIGKRKHSEDPSDGDDDGNCRPPKRLSKGKGLEAERLLACPFCKNDPITFRVCYKYILKNISRLKQHLERCHRIPPHCSACSQQFKNEEERKKHERSRSCEVQPEKTWKGVTEGQWAVLKGRVSRFKSQEENWYIIYSTIFPSAPRPSSPYVDIPGFTQDTLALIDFATNHGASILAPFMQNALPLELRPLVDNIQAFVESILPDTVGMLLAMWDSRRLNGTEPRATEEPLQTRSPASDGEQGLSLTSATTKSPGDAPTEGEYPIADGIDRLPASEYVSGRTSLFWEDMSFSESNEAAPGIPDITFTEGKDLSVDSFGWFHWAEIMDPQGS